VTGTEEILFLIFPLHYAPEMGAYGGKCSQFAVFLPYDDPRLAAKAEELRPAGGTSASGKLTLARSLSPFRGARYLKTG